MRKKVGKETRRRLRSLPKQRGYPHIRLRGNKPITTQQQEGRFYQGAHYKHTETQATLVYKVSIDPSLGACPMCKQCLTELKRGLCVFIQNNYTEPVINH